MIHTDPEALLAALAWQVDLGADEAIGDAPVDRFAPPEPVETAEAVAAPSVTKPAKPDSGAPDAATQATVLASAATTLADLRAAMEGFEGCDLRHGARNFVFSDGFAAADLMIVGEAPGREEDREGRPFVGRSGQLLDRMLAAIGRDRTADTAGQGVYITNVLPWRPPANRDPSKDEMAMMKPFLLRHIELAAPRALLLLGNSAMKTLFETERGITAMRGTWHEVAGVPAIASFHPAALLRNGLNKRPAWADLLDLKAKLEATE
ncbi:uracil-DNA glycosylase [Roseobacter sp. HKCCA0434]|uniref:uracil-DNA glycosylase n=1 Tax=Roseobacter sp. HKCCA0434 TaxID=3079297 RepID=UPI002905C7A4|nr:uracil-DNA glycosylase [Roseobacter sp. HKCCA0434]